jgi:hypothetical protein
LENLRFGYDAIRPKKPGTEKDTSFVVNVMDLTDNRIHSFCYGAGRNRVVDCTGRIYHTIDYGNLVNVTISNNITSIEDGSAYEAYLEVTDEIY